LPAAVREGESYRTDRISIVSEAPIRGFTKDAFDMLVSSDGYRADVSRAEAFAQFEAMPMPSPETEEWRYTDLRALDLAAYEPLREEPRAETLDDVKPGALEAAGDVGDRAGLAVQHNSSVVIAHLDPQLERDGVVFEGID